MREKELKKLSRLELLELLLEVSSENHELNARIEKLQADLKTAHSIEHLSAAIDQVEKILSQANHLVGPNSNATTPANIPGTENASTPLALLDKEIYKRLLHLYAENDNLLSALPLELQIAIKERTPSVLNKQA